MVFNHRNLFGDVRPTWTESADTISPSNLRQIRSASALFPTPVGPCLARDRSQLSWLGGDTRRAWCAWGDREGHAHRDDQHGAAGRLMRRLGCAIYHRLIRCILFAARALGLRRRLRRHPHAAPPARIATQPSAWQTATTATGHAGAPLPSRSQEPGVRGEARRCTAAERAARVRRRACHQRRDPHGNGMAAKTRGPPQADP